MSDTYYIVKDGDHLSGIAIQYGFADYNPIWDHPKNKDLKTLRQDPNILLPGDRLYIPERQERNESGGTEQRHKFKCNNRKIKLNIIFQNLDGSPIANADCTLELEGQTYKMKTDADGKVSREVPKTAKKCRILFEKSEALPKEIPILIGYLDPVDTLSGYSARLNNLGYEAGQSDESSDIQLRMAIEEFQADNPPLKVDGICGPQTQKKLKDIHGC